MYILEVNFGNNIIHYDYSWARKSRNMYAGSCARTSSLMANVRLVI